MNSVRATPGWSDKLKTRVTEMAWQMRNASSAGKNLEKDLEGGAMWKLYQSTHLLCFVERVALSDNFGELLAATQSPKDRVMLAQIDALLGRLRAAILVDSTAVAPTDTIWSGVTDLLKRNCGGAIVQQP
jgi:hypothetical protein